MTSVNAIRTEDHTLAVERHRSHPQCSQRLRDQRHPVGPIMTASGEHAHAVAIAPADETKAVVFDLVSPLRPGRHAVAVGRETWLDEAGRTADGTRIVPVHEAGK
jgi:hypothetical protein